MGYNLQATCGDFNWSLSPSVPSWLSSPLSSGPDSLTCPAHAGQIKWHSLKTQNIIQDRGAKFIHLAVVTKKSEPWDQSLAHVKKPIFIKSFAKRITLFWIWLSSRKQKLLEASKKIYHTWTAFLFGRFKKHTEKNKWMQEAQAYVLWIPNCLYLEGQGRK